MTARYAVYYTPPADDALTQRAANWLGRDAFTGAALLRPCLPGLEDLDLDALTADPRAYGFHATLNAPFELAAGATEQALLDFSAGFAACRLAFDATLAVASQGRFLAIRLAAPSVDVQRLHEACVRDFAPYRAPLSAADMARRRKAPLTPEQDAKLIAYGYPYVLNDFQFHMTLTNSIADALTTRRLRAALSEHFADLCGCHRFSGLSVFKQPDRNQPFRVLARFEFEDRQARIMP